jgi:hypothetical protein
MPLYIKLRMRTFLTILFLFCFSFISNAQTWHTMGSGVTGSTMAMPTVAVIYDYNGKIAIGGFFTNSGSIVLNGIGQWDGNLWQPMSTGIFDAILPPGNSGVGHDLLDYHNQLYFTGSFSVAGGINNSDTTHAAKNIAKWDGTAWQPIGGRWGNGFYGGGGVFQIYQNDLFIGGGFNVCLDTFGFHSTTTIAKWNDTTFSAVGQFHSNHPSGDDYVQDLCIYNGKLIAGGYFNSIDGSPYGSYGYVAAYVNDTTWDTLSTGLNNPVYALTVFNNELYAGGLFTATGDGTTAKHVAKWNGTQWLPVGEGLNDTVAVLYVDSLQNKLYAGGTFTQTGLGQPAKHIAEWNGTNWVEVGGGTNGYVQSLFAKDSNLYVGGAFTMAGTTPANRIAVWGNNSVGINEIGKKERKIKLYPNPNNGNMQLDYSLNEGEAGILKIMDVTGKLVASYVLENSKTNIAISEAALQNGVYFYQIIVNGEVVNSDKLVIIKN